MDGSSNLDTNSNMTASISLNYTRLINTPFTNIAEKELTKKNNKKSFEMSAISISKEGKERLYRNRLNNQVYLIKQSQNEISKYEISIDGEKWFYLPESSIKLYEEVNNENNKKMVIK